jgi:hypothetical protein
MRKYTVLMKLFIGLIIITPIITLTACSGKYLQSSPETVIPTLNFNNGVINSVITEAGSPTVTQRLSTTRRENVVIATVSPSTFIPTPEPSPTNLPQSPTPLPADFWMSMPVIPDVSETARDIYSRGLEMGRNPHAFSKIGDCQSIKTYFLAHFELPDYYDLGEYSSLQETLDWFEGSFSRESLAVKGGFNAAAILSPLRSNPQLCNADENPIACEVRVNNPSIAVVSLEEWWAGHPENYEKYMRQILEYLIEQGVVPVVATKADNLEGNHLINQTIALLALEYDIPLWNFWRAVQPLPNHGLVAYDYTGATDMFHLTHSEKYYFYNDPSYEQSGWSVRNLTALQSIDAVWRGLSTSP